MDNQDEPDWTLTTLLDTDVTGLDDTRTLAYLRAISQVEAKLEAARLRAVQHFSTLQERAADAPVRLARELKITRNNAARDVKLAHELAFRLPRTRAALEAGTLDPVRAAQVARATRELSDTEAHSVDDRLYPAALNKNPKPLGEFLRSAVAQEAPEAADKREKSRAQHKPADQPDPHGSDRFAALMDELDLGEIDRVIDDVARNRKREGDPRTVNELRLAVLRERLLGSGRLSFRTHVHVLATADTLAGFSELAGELRGYGLIPADRVRELAFSGNAVWTLAGPPISDDLRDTMHRTYEKKAGMVEFVPRRLSLRARWLSKTRRRRPPKKGVKARKEKSKAVTTSRPA
jgi:uncharacterized protein DUF222